MKFALPDGDNAWQEITIRENDKGDIVIDMYSAEDMTAIIEANKIAQSEKRRTLGKGTQTSMYHLGSLGAVQAHELIKKGIFQDDDALRKWFNDLDNYLWRTVDKVRRGGMSAVQGSQTDHRQAQ